jgi:hypothetical protein
LQLFQCLACGLLTYHLFDAEGNKIKIPYENEKLKTTLKKEEAARA